MQQNSFVVPTKHFAISIKFWLLKQNVLLGQENLLSGQQKNLKKTVVADLLKSYLKKGQLFRKISWLWLPYVQLVLP